MAADSGRVQPEPRERGEDDRAVGKDLSRRTQLLIRFGYDGSRFAGLQPQLPGIPTAGGALLDGVYYFASTERLRAVTVRS